MRQKLAYTPRDQVVGEISVVCKRKIPSALLVAGLAILASHASLAKTLVFCSSAAPQGFDPALHTEPATMDASSRQIYDRLVAYAPGTTDLVPALAESWEISGDGRTVTFTLRPGVPFHTTSIFTPTRTLNADDVIFSLKRQLNRRHAWHAYMPGAGWEYSAAMSMPEIVDDIVKTDDLTVQLVLTRPHAPIFALLAMDFASILSAEYAEQLDRNNQREQLDRQPVGTGPFALVAYQDETAILYKPHSKYWGGLPKVEKLVFSIVPDASDRRDRLEKGDCDIAADLSAVDVRALKGSPGLKLLETPAMDVGYLAFKTNRPPSRNSLVRKALNYAINQKAIIDGVFDGAGEAAKSPIPPVSWAYDPELETEFYDPGLALQLLEAAGLTKLSLSMLVMPVERPYLPDPERVARMIQADLQWIGVDVELVVPASIGRFLSRSTSQGLDRALLYGWSAQTGDPDHLLTDLLSCDAVGGRNRARWCNREFDGLLKKARETYDPDERARIYAEAMVIFKNEAPWMPIAHSIRQVPVSRNVKHYVPDPLGGHYFGRVDISE